MLPLRMEYDILFFNTDNTNVPDVEKNELREIRVRSFSRKGDRLWLADCDTGAEYKFNSTRVRRKKCLIELPMPETKNFFFKNPHPSKNTMLVRRGKIHSLANLHPGEGNIPTACFLHQNRNRLQKARCRPLLSIQLHQNFE
jgi:hypothetical protein